jgi:hypothetical protein
MHRHALGQYPNELWHQVHYPFGQAANGELTLPKWAGSRDLWFGFGLGIAFSFVALRGLLLRGVKGEAGVGYGRRTPSRRKTSAR